MNHHALPWQRSRCRIRPVYIHPVYTDVDSGTVYDMPGTDIRDKAVIVPAGSLDDLLELARLAAERLPDTDPLVSALRGRIAQVRVEALLEP